MSDTKTYGNVTPGLFACVKAKSSKEHGTTYEPPDSNKGTSTTQSIVGKVVLDYELNPETSELTYTLVEKPVLAPEYAIWNGIEDAINGCR